MVTMTGEIIHPNWSRVAYLASGTPRQQSAYQALQSLRIFDILRDYSPVLAGTIPLAIDIESSDLDIICEAHDLDAIESHISFAYGGQPDFSVARTTKNNLRTLIARFTYGTWPVEIFAQPRLCTEQNAFRHMVAEAHLLRTGGEPARRAIRDLKSSGFKTEPAFASYFLLPGDPYEALLDFENRMPKSDMEREELAHTFWIGGSPCSGKSSIARILSKKYGLQVYSCDDQYEAHLKRAIPGKHPRMSRASGSTWDDVWMHPVEYLIEREFAFYHEEFEMIIEDLLTLPSDTPICAEGAALLPECVLPLLNDHSQAIWIVPTEQFQRQEYARREWVQGILAQCSLPEQAWENWMGRDAGFARKIALQAERLGFTVLEVDGTQSLQSNAEQVAEYLSLSGRGLDVSDA